MKHIVVEGMDGSGKDTLIEYLLKYKNWPRPFELHERASTSTGGPVSNLTQWTVEDLAAMAGQPPSIYNRHPMISELVYAPIVRGHLIGKFQSPSWVRLSQAVVASHCIVVFCHPSFRTITENLEKSGKDAHMPGVVDKANQLYLSYSRMVMSWKGPKYTYDYTKSKPQYVAEFIRSYMSIGGPK